MDEETHLASIRRFQRRALKAVSRSDLVVREIIARGEQLNKNQSLLKEFLKISEELPPQAGGARYQGTLDIIDQISKTYKKVNQLRAKLDTTAKTNEKQYRRAKWNLGRSVVNLSRLVRSLEFSNSERRYFNALIKSTVERLRPIEQELARLERKADRAKKRYRKAIQKDIRAVRAKIAAIETDAGSSSRELKRTLQTIVANDAQVASRIQALDELRERLSASAQLIESPPTDMVANVETSISVEIIGTEIIGTEAPPEFGNIEAESPPEIKEEVPNGVQRQRTYRARKIDFEAIDEVNRRLGKRGEDLVVEYERRRLIAIDRPDLAERVHRVSEAQGDGAGYDVLSFTDDGREMYIEVKATTLGKQSPFLISINELEFSKQNEEQFYLYRIFNLSQSPRLFILRGSLSGHRLEPTQFRVSF